MVKLGYVRVSREKQDPESQIVLLKEMGVMDPDIYVDHGISGWTDPTARPVYKEMMKRLSEQDPSKKVTEIIFSEFSRLGRNAKESIYELIRLEKLGIAVKSLSAHESFINQLPSEIQLTILAGMATGAELERKHLQERTKWGLNRVKEYGSRSGKPIGRPRVVINWEEIQKTMEQFRVPEKVAVRICGYNESTFYKAKKMKEKGGGI
jgi:putative DNA-invertase from lambdoid prophage Rac